MRTTPRVAGFRSESPAGFELECMAGFVGIRTKGQMAQDDFMFNAVEGGAFVPDPQISTEGSRMLFQNGHPDWPMA